MVLADAIKLINSEQLHGNIPVHWADLGCGSGLFSKALASILPRQSTIIAIDKNDSSLKNLSGTYNEVFIETQEADFTTITFDTQLDGVLMANALHYVKDQQQFVAHLQKQIKKGGYVIVVEYDTDKANPWVPYPINAKKLKIHFEQQGFISIEIIGKQHSIYGAEMYAAIIKN